MPLDLYCNYTLDVWMRLIAFEREILETEIVDIVDIWIDAHCRERIWLTCNLLMHLVEVIKIDMRVAESVYELPWLKAAHLRDHHGKEGVGSDIERDTEEDVGRALIEHTAKSAVGDIELEHCMARREGHIVDFGHVPGTDEEST